MIIVKRAEFVFQGFSKGDLFLVLKKKHKWKNRKRTEGNFKGEVWDSLLLFTDHFL